MLDEPRFLLHRPFLYHFTSTLAWPAIKRHGLLCTADLLQLLPKAERAEVRHRRRKDSCIVSFSDGDSAVIRDQKPLYLPGLVKALHGSMSTDEWIDLLNARVFFWTHPAHARKLTGAASYRNTPGLLLKLRTESVVEAYRERIQLADINTGYTGRKPVPRDRNTFQSLLTYPHGPISRIRELTILGSLPDIKEHVLEEPVLA